MNNNESKIKIINDFSSWFLFLANAVAIFFAVEGNWGLPLIALIAWFQSLMVGVFNFVRILELKEFSTRGFKINERHLEPTIDTKFSTAFLFLFHYGLFHIIYIIFIFSETNLSETISALPGTEEINKTFLILLLFFVNHLFSYSYNKSRNTKKLNLASIMFFPYARIVPMHFIIVFGVLFEGSPIFFLLLKIIADIGMHLVAHNILRKG